MATATIHLDASGHATLKTPYRAGFVDELKAEVPPEYREWQPSVKCWWIHRDFVGLAGDICREWYEEVQTIEPSRESSPSNAQADGPYAALHLLPDAPWPLVEAAYRKLAAMNHPDLGGDVRAMQQINTAFERLRKLKNV